MGTSERRERERAQLRTAILDAARRIVGAGGRWEDLTIRKIADEIEYAPATLYAHFASRDDIVRALCIDGYRQLLEALEPVAHDPDPERRVRAIARAYVAFGLANPATYRIVFMEDPRITQALLEANGNDPEGTGDRAFALLVDSLGQFLNATGFKANVTPALAADMLWTALHGLVALKITCPAFPQTETYALLDATLDALFAGIRQTRSTTNNSHPKKGRVASAKLRKR